MLLWTEAFATGNSSNNLSQRINTQGSTYNTTSHLTSTGRTGSLYADGTLNIALNGTDRVDTLILGAAFIRGSGQSNNDSNIIEFYDTASTLAITINLKRTAGIYNLVLIYNSITYTGPVITFPTSTWYYIETKVKLHDTTGSIEVKIDEVLIATLTNIDTKPGSATTFGQVILYGSTNNFSGFDDFYLCDTSGSRNNDYLGAVKIEALTPNANGTYSMGINSTTSNSINNYQSIDEAIGNFNTGYNSDYVDLLATNDKDTYNYTNLTEPSSYIVKAVNVVNWAEKTDAGARNITATARLAGVDIDGPTVVLNNGTYLMRAGIIETKPDGGTWTVNDVNNAEFGAKAA